ncbi:MAG: hypothetical protein ACLGIF_08330, partial [Actinomycetes bacterium]
MADTTPALPPGARLLHIGIPKTGTTALQRAAAARRARLSAHGVCYPGRTVNHREAVCALMGRRLGWLDAGDYVPSRRHWERLRAELDAAGHERALVSHEFVSECTDEQARRFREELGPTLYVAVTLRGFAHLLPSSWQQYLKAGRRKAFRPWLAEILADDPHTRAAANFSRRTDQAALVRRWAEVVGPEWVIVVLADKARPTQLTDAFEDLLGLPRGALDLAGESGFASNRALSWPEAELLRRLNYVARKPRITWQDYDLLVRGGAITRLLENRRPRDDEPPVRLPAWAAERASARAQAYATDIAASGCRVVGDLDSLLAPVATSEGPDDPGDQVPVDAAVELAAGLLSAALGRGAFFDVGEAARTPVLRRLTGTARGRRLA